jgi:hypothetical protein
MGRGGTPDVLVARTSLGEGRTFGRDLAATLGLPIEEVSRAY